MDWNYHQSRLHLRCPRLPTAMNCYITWIEDYRVGGFKSYLLDCGSHRRRIQWMHKIGEIAKLHLITTILMCPPSQDWLTLAYYCVSTVYVVNVLRRPTNDSIRHTVYGMATGGFKKRFVMSSVCNHCCHYWLSDRVYALLLLLLLIYTIFSFFVHIRFASLSNEFTADRMWPSAADCHFEPFHQREVSREAKIR